MRAPTHSSLTHILGWQMLIAVLCLLIKLMQLRGGWSVKFNLTVRDLCKHQCSLHFNTLRVELVLHRGRTGWDLNLDGPLIVMRSICFLYVWIFVFIWMFKCRFNLSLTFKVRNKSVGSDSIVPSSCRGCKPVTLSWDDSVLPHELLRAHTHTPTRAHTPTHTKERAICLHSQGTYLWEWQTWASDQISPHPSRV